MDAALKQAIVIRGQFAQVSIHPGMNIKAFVSGYMFRADADEPLIMDDRQQDDYLAMLTKLNVPEDQNADEILNHRLRYNGIGFDKDKLSLSRDEQMDYANQAQQAYEQGHSIKQLVLTFNTQWLKEHGVLDDELTEPIKSGDLRGKVDQRRLRTAVQDGMNRMFEQSTMRDPQMAAAVQTDTKQVHVHMAVWDADPGAVNDHGKILAREKNAIRTGMDDSLRLQPGYVNEVNNLGAVAKSTQQNARFKRALLKRELYHSALRLDQVSLNEYVDNLAQYDQKTLSQDQRQSLANSIQKDWQTQGHRTTRSHKLTYGQRRRRRQLHGMVRTRDLRMAMRQYQQRMGHSQTSQDSQVVYDAMRGEVKRQLTIVEKYRLYQRPRVNAIYQSRQPELQTRRAQLLKRRETLLPKLNTQSLRSGYVKRLLQKQPIMQNLKRQFPNQPLSKTDVYKDLAQASDDDTHVLKPKTIQKVINGLDPKVQDQITSELTRNQKIDRNTMSPQQRLWLAQYEQDLNEYEFDAVSYGGLNVKNMKLSSLHDHSLLVPDETASIYDRESSKDDPDVMGIDFDQIIESGPLKKNVELAVRRNLTLRYRRLKQANDYFEQTGQDVPKWLKESQMNLGHQYQVMNKKDGPVAKLEPQKETNGYELAEKPLETLVNKHIQTVNELEL